MKSLLDKLRRATQLARVRRRKPTAIVDNGWAQVGHEDDHVYLRIGDRLDYEAVAYLRPKDAQALAKGLEVAAAHAVAADAGVKT